jgi:DNA repair exonuclease SbcCD ATPase subunit
MGGRTWLWLLELAPVREAVRREVAAAVDSAMGDAEDLQARQRDRHRNALDRAERELHELRIRVDELNAANAELLGANASLRGELAELAESTEVAARREEVEREEFALRMLREQEAAQARQWQGMSTDVFCCQSCWAFWFLSTTADSTGCMVRGPFGRHDEACTVCAEPLVALPAAKSVVFRKRAHERISRPVLEEEQTGETVVVSAELDAIATGLAKLPKVSSRTVAWIATGLPGAVQAPATVLGEIATRTTMPVPLDGIVAGIRAFAEVSTPKHV